MSEHNDTSTYKIIIYNEIEYYLDVDDIVYKMDTENTYIPIGNLTSRTPITISFTETNEEVDMIEIEYLGKSYILDENTKDVYEKINDEYLIVGKLTSESPIHIKFNQQANWMEEYADIEPHTYNGVEYMINPNTKNVFIMDINLGEYTYVGTVVTLNPLHINFEKEQEEETVELEVIEDKGIKYVKDEDNNVYDGKKFVLVGKWDNIDKEIDYLPSRGFLNINNSCYINSVLFALFYRDNKFISNHILRKDIDNMMKELDIKDIDIIKSVKQNQTELLKIYKWLHNKEQSSNTSKVCQPFRKIYTRVDLDNKPMALHDKAFEREIGDSAEFLFNLFNGFNIKTILKEQKSYARIDSIDKVISSDIQKTPPIIIISPTTKQDQYFKQTIKYDLVDNDTKKQLESSVKLNKIKILLEFYQKKTRVPKAEKEKIRQTINKIDIQNILDEEHKIIDDFYMDLTNKLNPKEKKEIELLYKNNEDLNTLIEPLEKKPSKEKLEITEYREMNSIDLDYLIFEIDRTGLIGNDLVFDIKENIITPSKKSLELQFVIKYLEKQKHYVCYFKKIEDDLWYVYDDLKQNIHIVSSGTFESMKKETQSSCRLLFYGEQI